MEFDAGYIKPNGEVVLLKDYNILYHFQYENLLIEGKIIEQPQIMQTLREQKANPKLLTNRYMTQLFNWIRIKNTTNPVENVAQLPLTEITDEQYDVLTAFFDDLVHRRATYVDVGIERTSRGPGIGTDTIWYQHFEFDEWMVDAIIKEIKKQYKLISKEENNL